MKIFLNHERLHIQSRTRGVGVYTRELLFALQKNYPQDEIISAPAGAVAPDLIHYPFFDPFSPTLKISPQCPTVVTVHDLIPLRFPAHFPVGIRGRLAWWRQLRTLRRVSHVLTDSLASRGDILKLTGLSPTMVTVVPLGSHRPQRLGAALLAKIADSYSLPPSYLLYVGDINWNKNVVGLIKAFGKLGKPNLSLVLVGKVFSDQPDIPEYREIKKAIAASPQAERIRLLGYVPSHHLPLLYSRALLYVQPSWYEGFGLPLLEAMKFGCPVAASRRGSLPEVGGDAVAYFDPGKDMAEVIETLLRSPSRLSQLGAQGAERAKAFTWERTARETHAVYEKILAARR